MPPPPPAEGIASRLFLGPALRTQPDRRLVSLVRQGYETAFEEIVRRYGKLLGRYAAAIVPRQRAEDVTQDAFSKALLALRHSDAEIELRPWLFRIVRNTALNDIRDQPPPAQELFEGSGATGSALEATLRNEDVADLMRRLSALPEPQRAAIVMRELEGLSHEEIAAALGVTGGAARQTIHRARQTLRDGVGLLIPVPMLKLLLGGGAGVPAGVATGAGAGGAATAAAGGAGGGIALKTAAATLLVAGTVGGLALEEHSASSRAGADPVHERHLEAGRNRSLTGAGDAAILADESQSGTRDSGPSGAGGSGSEDDGSSGPGGGDARSGDYGGGSGTSGGGELNPGDDGEDHSGSSSSSGPGPGPRGGDDGSGISDSGTSGSDSSGPGPSGGGDSGSGSSGPGPSGSGDETLDLLAGDHSGPGPGSGSSGTGEDGSGSDTSGSDPLSGGSGPD